MRKTNKSVAAMILLAACQFGHAAVCEYVMQTDWKTGFVANIKITNDSPTMIDRWEVSWRYTDDSVISHSWNVVRTGSNPYTAKSLSWNSQIRPGETKTFGFQGNKSPSSSGLAEVTGDICGSSPAPGPAMTPGPRPTARPTAIPTPRPTARPTAIPTPRPTARPTAIPTPRPTARPTAIPTPRPTARPTAIPTPRPTARPTAIPTPRPTARPTAIPTPRPTARPTAIPTPSPTPQTAPDITNGKRLYDGALSCGTCHGDKGQGAAFTAINVAKASYTHSREPNTPLNLVDYIVRWMPVGNINSCVGNCARDVAAYVETLQTSVVAPNLACEVDRIDYGRRQMRLLTVSEYQKTLFDLLGYRVDAQAEGVPADTFIGGFSNQVQTAVTQAYADAYEGISKKAADFAQSRNFAGVVNCSGLNGNRCANKLVDEFGTKAFRRPLTAAERNRYVSLFSNQLTSGSNNEGIKLALRAMLNSPYFLMRSEMGVRVSSLHGQIDQRVDSDAFVLTPYEMATFLAYTYTGTTPDSALLQAAAGNNLRTDLAIQAQIDRLLQTAKARDHFGEFAAQWLRTDRVLSVVKDTNTFPGFTQRVRRAMAQEVREVFKHVMFDQNRPITELYSDFSFLNRDLADFYGISGNFDNTFRKVDKLQTRGGIVTSGAFMAGFANNQETSPIQRAVAVRELMMCQDVPPMPTNIQVAREDADAKLADFIRQQGGTISNRERFHFLTKEKPCSDCHNEIINPHGFGMEDFDAVGLPRVSDKNGLVIDASGQLIGLQELTDGQSASFVGARAFSDTLKELDATQACFIEKGFRFVMGSGHNVFDTDNANAPKLTESQKEGFECAIETMANAMSAANQNPREALRVLGLKDIVRYRK